MTWWYNSPFFDQILGLGVVTLFLIGVIAFSIMYFYFRDKTVRHK